MEEAKTTLFDKVLNKQSLIEGNLGLKINNSKNLEQNMDDFKKIAITLTSLIDEKIGGESLIILLNYLLDSYKELKATIKFGKTAITLDEVNVALCSWEVEKKPKLKNSGNMKSLNVTYRSNERNSKGRGKFGLKSKNVHKIQCYHCQKVLFNEKEKAKKEERN